MGIAIRVQTIGKGGAHPLAQFAKVININLVGMTLAVARDVARNGIRNMTMQTIVTNEMLNGEVIRLDGAIRLAPK